jgi:tetratricopeptide (TPR) repeat protein
MRMLKQAWIVLFALVLCASVASAQSWRGMGRVSGKVMDEEGRPLEGATVKLNLPGVGGTELKTNKKGEWQIGGISRGDWQIDIEMSPYEPRRISVSVAELSRVPPVEVKLKLDINEAIRVEVVKAGELIAKNQYADARKVYEGVLAKYPSAYRLESYLARTYYLEKNYDEAIRHMKIAIEKDPSDLENKLRLGNILMETGRMDEGRQLLATVDDSAVKDPAIFINIGISLMNQNKADEALPYFDKATKNFPDKADGYYYRALIRLQKGDLAGTKADLSKYLELAPNGTEAAAARKALEQIK